MGEKLKFKGEYARGQTRYSVWLGPRMLGEVFTDRPGLWVATDGERTWSAGKRQRAAEFLLPTQQKTEP